MYYGSGCFLGGIVAGITSDLYSRMKTLQFIYIGIIFSACLTVK